MLHPTHDDAAGDAEASKSQAASKSSDTATTSTSLPDGVDEPTAAAVAAALAAETLLPMASSLQLVDLEKFMKSVQLSNAERNERSQLVQRVSMAVAKHLQLSVDDVVAVGSFACGLATIDSDLDLAVIRLPATADVEGADPNASSRVENDENVAARRVLLATVADAIRKVPGLTPPVVVLTRSRAPDLVSTTDAASGVHIDVSLRHGSGGAGAGAAKEAFLRGHTESCVWFRSLAVAVKTWAKKRELVDPEGRLLNSFTWTLMALHFLQVLHLAGTHTSPPTTTATVAAAASSSSGSSTATSTTSSSSSTTTAAGAAVVVGAAAASATSAGDESGASFDVVGQSPTTSATANTATIDVGVVATESDGAANIVDLKGAAGSPTSYGLHSLHSGGTTGSDSAADVGESHGLHSLLVGFFAYWRQFDFSSDAVSTRLGRAVPLSDLPDLLVSETQHSACMCVWGGGGRESRRSLYARAHISIACLVSCQLAQMCVLAHVGTPYLTHVRVRALRITGGRVGCTLPVCTNVCVCVCACVCVCVCVCSSHANALPHTWPCVSQVAESGAPCRCFYVEDPIESDENTARTLSDRT
jgi:predicted nucleotidyltransferase